MVSIKTYNLTKYANSVKQTSIDFKPLKTCFIFLLKDY